MHISIIVIMIFVMLIMCIYINCFAMFVYIMLMMIRWIIRLIIGMVISAIICTSMRNQRIIVVPYGSVNMPIVVKSYFNKPTISMKQYVEIGVAMMSISLDMGYIISKIIILNGIFDICR